MVGCPASHWMRKGFLLTNERYEIVRVATRLIFHHKFDPVLVLFNNSISTLSLIPSPSLLTVRIRLISRRLSVGPGYFALQQL